MKPSATKAEALLNRSTFYIDDCLGSDLAELLRAKGLAVEDHRDHFQRAKVTDTEIYELLGPRGWIFVTKDKALRKNEYQIDDLIRYNIRVLSLSQTNLSTVAVGDLLWSVRLKIGRLLKDNPPPFIADVGAGKVEIPEVIRGRIVAARVRAAEAAAAAARPAPETGGPS